VGFDGQVHREGGPFAYANYSGWDIYRSEVPLKWPRSIPGSPPTCDLAAQRSGAGRRADQVAESPNAESVRVMNGDGPSNLAEIYAFGARG